ncbi:MAG: Ig-like domain-containing protein, partial [Bacteroidota bacterium]
MSIKNFLYCIFICSALYFTGTAITGCAQMGYPTGGLKDTIPPVLVNAFPPEGTTNFSGDKIVLAFDEYIDMQDIQNNLLMSPFPKTAPNISFKLKTVTVKIKDTLQPNTTYAIDFGNSLKDLNEGNPYKNYTYVFSTGNAIDSLTLSGNVTLAESGKTDSTLIVMLYKNSGDSTVQNRKPDYIARLNRKGDYRFKNLSEGTYKLYALKDGDGGKTYNSVTETFAFASTDIVVSSTAKTTDTLFAYAEEKDVKKTAATTT